jgi:hypothetical protein
MTSTVTIPPAPASAKLTNTMVSVLRFAIETKPVTDSVMGSGIALNRHVSVVTIDALVRRGFMVKLGRAEWGTHMVDVTESGLEWAVENLTD